MCVGAEGIQPDNQQANVPLARGPASRVISKVYLNFGGLVSFAGQSNRFVNVLHALSSVLGDRGFVAIF
jgi:hypothetical protein